MMAYLRWTLNFYLAAQWTGGVKPPKFSPPPPYGLPLSKLGPDSYATLTDQLRLLTDTLRLLTDELRCSYGYLRKSASVVFPCDDFDTNFINFAGLKRRNFAFHYGTVFGGSVRLLTTLRMPASVLRPLSPYLSAADRNST